MNNKYDSGPYGDDIVRIDDVATPITYSNSLNSFTNPSSGCYRKYTIMTAQHNVKSYAPMEVASGLNLDYFGQKTCGSSKKKTVDTKEKICGFCKNNGEPFHVYTSHSTKDKRGRVVCLKLRSFICHICGATGDYAHTKKYCPDKPIKS